MDTIVTKEQLDEHDLDWREYRYEPEGGDREVDVDKGTKVVKQTLIEAKGIDQGPFLAAQVPFNWVSVSRSGTPLHVAAGGYAVAYDDEGHVAGVAEARFDRDYVEA